MQSSRFLAAGFTALIVSAGATSQPPVGPLASADGPTSNVEIASGFELPAPDGQDYALAFRPYLIGPFDVLEIGVFGIDEFQQREYRADASGRVSFPLIGTIDAGGLTPAQLEQEIARRLQTNYVRDPQVTVNLKETTSRVVTVAGQVREPGPYPVLGRMTLVRAIAAAGGAGDFAKTSEVLVFRTVDGQRMAAIYDLRGIQRGNYDDPEIYPNDVVIVGDSPQKRLIRDAIGVAPALVAPLLVTLFQAN